MPADYLTPRSPRSAAPAWPGTSPRRLRCILIHDDGVNPAARLAGARVDEVAAIDDEASLASWIEAQRARRPGGAVAAVTNEGVIRRLLVGWLEADPTRAERLRVDRGNLAVIDLDENGVALRALNVERP